MMKSILVLLSASLTSAAMTIDVYPAHPIQPFPLAEDEILMKPFAQVVGPLLHKYATDSEKAALSREAVHRFESGIQEKTLRQWSLVRADGRMPLPSILIHPNHYGLEEGVEVHYFVELLANNPLEQSEFFSLGLLWAGLMQWDAPVAFKRLAQAADRETVTTADVLRLFASLGSSPGARLPSAPDKADWQILHNSKNPCYRFIALEKFDSVKQSPEEMLALYRECLFGACSYLEVRALEAIDRNKDFREDVAKVLEEYIASNPPANDGTLPTLRNRFQDLIAGAKSLISTIRQ